MLLKGLLASMELHQKYWKQNKISNIPLSSSKWVWAISNTLRWEELGPAVEVVDPAATFLLAGNN